MKLQFTGPYKPEYATEGAAGFDLRAMHKEPTLLRAGTRRLIPTGLRVAIPEGYELQIRPRSGLSKNGVDVALGTIDSDYRGEIFICVIGNMQKYKGHWIQPNDRIAQAVLAPVVRAEFEMVDELSETARGSGGYGSTGVE
jgi:dUTP pyrophosphatase